MEHFRTIYGGVIGNPMLEVELTGCGRNVSETVADAASEACTRWLHHLNASIKLPLMGAYH